MIFIADTKQGVLRESPGKWPSCDDVVDENLEGTLKERMVEWLRISEDPQVYPLIGDGWEDGKEYQDSEIELGPCKECQIGVACKHDSSKWFSPCILARLKQPEESQEQMWAEIISWGVTYNGTPEDFKILTEELSKSFTITRK